MMGEFIRSLWPWLAGGLVLVWILVELGGFHGCILRRLPRVLARRRHQLESGGLVISAPHELAGAIDNGLIRPGQRLEVRHRECRIDSGGYTLRFAAPAELADGGRFRVLEVRRRSLALARETGGVEGEGGTGS